MNTLKGEYGMSQKPEQPQPRQIRIEIDDGVADGIYANLAFISNNPSEFIIDFARFLPGNTRGKVVSRIIISPVHAKALLKSLTESVGAFETRSGAITLEPHDKNIGFQINSDKSPDVPESRE